MTNGIRTNGPAMSRFPVIALVVALIALTITLTLAPLHSWSENAAITVDFDVVVTTAGWIGVAVGDRRPTLRFAIGAMNSPRTTREQYAELLSVVADRVGRGALLAQRKTYAEINDMIERKEVDVAFVCTAPYVMGRAKFGMEILAVPVTQGHKVYHSYILAHRDSSVSSFDDLRGKVFVFTDPLSNTGCLVPKYMLLERAETAHSFFTDVYYTYSHDNSIKAVAEGIADGAAVDSLVWEYLQETDPTSTSLTKIVHKSPPYGIPPVVVHPDLDRDLKDRVKQVFLGLHEEEEARNILRALRIDRFEEGDDAAYDSVREMWQVVSRAGG